MRFVYFPSSKLLHSSLHTVCFTVYLYCAIKSMHQNSFSISILYTACSVFTLLVISVDLSLDTLMYNICKFRKHRKMYTKLITFAYCA